MPEAGTGITVTCLRDGDDEAASLLGEGQYVMQLEELTVDQAGEKRLIGKVARGYQGSPVIGSEFDGQCLFRDQAKARQECDEIAAGLRLAMLGALKGGRRELATCRPEDGNCHVQPWRGRFRSRRLNSSAKRRCGSQPSAAGRAASAP